MKIPIVLVGLPDLDAVMQANKQLKGRFQRRCEIPLFSINTGVGENEFRTYLHVVDLKLPLKERSNLADPQVARMLFEASEGNNRTLMEHIIIPATLEAMEMGLSRLDIDHLRKQAEKIYRNVFFWGSISKRRESTTPKMKRLLETFISFGRGPRSRCSNPGST